MGLAELLGGLGLAIIMGAAGGAGAAVRAEGARYTFAEGGGSVLHDTSGSRRHGRIRGAQWVRSNDRGGLRFSGAGDAVDCGDALDLPPGAPASFEMWFQPQELPAGEALLLASGGFRLWYSGGAYPARVYFQARDAGGAGRARAPVGLWHHVAAVFDGAGLRIYIDGTMAGGVRRWRQPPPDSSRFLIGGGLSGFQSFTGVIGAARVVRRALSAGDVLVRYRAGKAGRKPLCPPDPPAAAPAGARRLNNLVAELLTVREPAGRSDAAYRFVNPRDGWVFASAAAASGAIASLASGGDRLVRAAVPGPELEAMWRLPAGPHDLRVECAPGASHVRVIVRAIPELIYATFPSDPIVPAYGRYTRDFLQKDVLRSANVLVGVPDEATREFAAEWRRAGRRCISEHTAPWVDPRTGRPSSSSTGIAAALEDRAGLRSPDLDGMVLDTHDISHSAIYPAYAAAVRRVASDPRYRDRSLLFYCDCLYGARESRDFAQAVLEAGGTLVWTRYMHEQPSLTAAREFLDAGLVDEIVGWRKYVPGAVERMVLALGYLMSPGERMDVEPGADYHALMEMQCRLVATHPAFQGLRGVMWYKSGYTDEESVRWAGRLFRHYFIEGRTDRLSADPYALPHLRNPDFTQGLEGWDVDPAEPGSITADRLDRYGFLQGRWLETGAGDRYACMRRSAARANTIAQTVRGLQPGRRYSLTLITADYDDVVQRRSVRGPHAVSVQIRGAAIDADRSFEHPYGNWSYYHLGPFDDEAASTKTWINFHRIVFRAEAPTARLVIADRAAPGAPQGPVGQRLLLNFVQVQPYIE